MDHVYKVSNYKMQYQKQNQNLIIFRAMNNFTIFVHENHLVKGGELVVDNLEVAMELLPMKLEAFAKFEIDPL